MDPVFEELLQEPRLRALAENLRALGRVAVAYSGGTDSAFLLRVAHEVLGERAHGVLAHSESLDREEYRRALELASALDLPVSVIETREYQNPSYRQNDGSRCYHCKKELFVEVKAFALRQGIPHVLDGSHVGDAGDYRPGLEARNEEGVRSPLMEVGLTKEDIRRYSRALGLPTWDKPAAPCLASRIPYGSEVTFEKLRQVEAAEKVLRDLGFSTVRVRHHGDVARLEVPRERFGEILEPVALEAVVEGVKGAGFLFVALDLEGFRSGSLNSQLRGGGRAAAAGQGAAASGPRVEPFLVQVEPLGR